MNRIPNSWPVWLLATAVAFGGLTACSHGSKSDSASTNVAPPPAVEEAPPPPEPASALGSASGTLRMADFAKETDFYAYDSERSDAHLAKAQGQVAEQFHSAMARWKPGSHSLVIYLFTDSMSADEADKLKTSIVNDGDAIQKRSATSRQIASITVTLKSYPPATGTQTASVIVSSRGSNGRFYSATGSADVQLSSLPVTAAWAKPGRVLPEMELRTSGKSHYSGSSFGSSEWQIETRVPVIYTSGY